MEATAQTIYSINEELQASNIFQEVAKIENRKKVYFIKKIPCHDCCFEILSFSHHREDVEVIMKLLSKEARNYLIQNIDQISKLKSKFSYKFSACSPIDLRNLQVLDLTSTDFQISDSPKDQQSMMTLLSTLSKVKESYKTSNLTQLSLNLSSNLSVQFIAYLSRIYTIQTLNLTQCSSASLQLLLSLPNLQFKDVSIELPKLGFKLQGPAFKQIETGLLQNSLLRSLSLCFSESVNNQYQDFTSLLLNVSHSLQHLRVDLKDNDYIQDDNFPKLFSFMRQQLTSLEFFNCNFPDKHCYLQLCSYLGQLPNVQTLKFNNCTFYDKLKGAIFTQLNLRLKDKLKELRLVDVVVDQGNIGGVIEMVKQNAQTLKVFELNRFLKGKPKMLPIDEVIAALKQLDTLIFRDPKIRMGPTLVKSFIQFRNTQTNLKTLDVECQSYEDIFELGDSSHISIDSLTLVAEEISNFSANKLLFDIAQGRITLKSLKLSGSAFSDTIIKKLPQITSKQKTLTTLEISNTLITEGSLLSLQNLLIKANSLKQLNITQNKFSMASIQEIFTIPQQAINLIKFQIDWPKSSLKEDKIQNFSWLQYMPLLSFLDLSQLTLNDPHEVQSLVVYLRSTASDNLRTFLLPLIVGDKLCEDVIQCLWEHPFLQRVHISFTFSIDFMENEALLIRSIRHIQLPYIDQLSTLIQSNKGTCFTVIAPTKTIKPLKNSTAKILNQLYNSNNR